ncbi:MAG: RloB family protein [Planctomycetaceae bacterium]|nr:RloB family protein [Planctomycetaceae bacterium]
MQHSFFGEYKPFDIDKRIPKRRILIYLNVYNNQFALQYFNRLKKFVRQTVVLDIKDTPPHPDDAITLASDSLETNEYDECWVVVDRELSFNFQQVLEKSKEANVNVIYCNLSFELWVLLHFRNVDKNERLDRNSIWQELKRLSKSERHQILDHMLDENNMAVAIKRAELLYREQGGSGAWKNNPSTNFFEIIESIVNLP